MSVCSISIIFVADQNEELYKRLERFFTNMDSKMTQDKYYELMAQMGKEPIEEEIPPDWTDFPEIVQHAIIIYNKLGDRVAADIGFLGKDYTILPTLLKSSQVEDELDIVLEILNWLETRSIRKSAEALKKERDKIKRKK